MTDDCKITCPEIEKNLVVNGTISLKSPLSISQGGTGATTAEGARTNLGIDGIVSTINTKIKNNTDNITAVSNRASALEKYAHIKDIQMGIVYNTGAIGTVSANSYKDYTVTFPRAFSSAPFVMCCFEMDTSATSFGRCTVTVKNETTTTATFTFRVYNGSSEGRSPRVRWLAIEMA